MSSEPRTSSGRVAVWVALALLVVAVVGISWPALVPRLRRLAEAPAAAPPAATPARGPAPQKLAEAERKWGESTAIVPSESVPDASGERVRWFQGFGLSVESRPAGASVLVNGRDLGRTPLVTSVECDPGDPVRVELRKPPRHAALRTLRCRKDQLVELTFDLK
jgi:hypothetical protein